PGQPGRPNTSSKPPPQPGWPPGRMWLIFALVLLVNFAITRFFAPGAETPIAVPYTVFKQEVTRGNVEAIYSRGADVEGQFAKAVTYPTAQTPERQPAVKGLPRGEPRTSRTFKTTLPTFLEPGLESLLIQHNVEILA